MLKIYLECGLYDTTDEHGNPIAKLKTSGMQEAVVFSDVHTGCEAYVRLGALDKRIALRWVMPSAPELGPPGCTPFKVWVRPENATNTKIYGAGHLVSGLNEDFELIDWLSAMCVDSTGGTSGIGYVVLFFFPFVL